MIKIIYAFLLGVILALFIGLGIEAFYPTEKYPEYPSSLQYAMPINGVMSPENLKIQQDYDQKTKEFQARNNTHAQNVSLAATIGSILLMILSLTVLNKTDIFADGFLIGSLMTLIYGIARGFEGDNGKYKFIVISVGLVFALVLGYLKFLRKEKD